MKFSAGDKVRVLGTLYYPDSIPIVAATKGSTGIILSIEEFRKYCELNAKKSPGYKPEYYIKVYGEFVAIFLETVEPFEDEETIYSGEAGDIIILNCKQIELI
jgi:hypothetical protein